MANRRKLKKEIKKETNYLIEDAFIESIQGDEKEAKKMDGIIDNIIDDRFEMLSKVSNYPKGEKRGVIKKYFKDVRTTLAEKKKDYTSKIGTVK